MHLGDCLDCSRLWQEYRDSTTNHIRLQGKHRIAQLQRDTERIGPLAVMVTEAEDRRNAARAAIRQHEAGVHGIMSEQSTAAGGTVEQALG